MPAEKHMDIVVLAPGFDSMGVIGSAFEAFDALLIDNRSPATFAAIGQLQDVGHHFGPLLKLAKKGQSANIRIAWHQILGIMSGGSHEVTLNTLGLGPAKIAKRN